MIRQVRFLCAAVLFPLSALCAQEVFGVDEWLKKPVNDKTFESFRPFFTYDSRLPFAIKVIDTTVTEGVFNEHFSFQSTLGVRVTARLFQLADQRGKRIPGMILLHGASATGKDNPGPTRYALYFAKAGYRVLAIDMPNFGERASGLLTTFTSPDMAEHLYNEKATYLSFIQQVVKDVRRSHDLLVSERQADSTRIILVGGSRGAILAIHAGAIDHRFAAVVLMIPGHMIDGETGHLAAACDANYIGRIAPTPLLIMSGKSDPVFPPEQVTQLQRLARGSPEILWEDAGHQVLPESQAKIVAWLQRILH